MQRKPPDARQAVLEAAITAFAAKGYAGTSVLDILKVTGLSKPTLYYYFKSKARLFRAILDFAYDEAFRLMQDGVESKTTCEAQLIGVTAAFFAFAERHRSLIRLVFATVFAAPEEIPPGSIDLKRRQRNLEFVMAILRAGQKTRELDPGYDPLELTHGILGAISHRTRTHLLQAKGPLDGRCAERVVSLFLNGARQQSLN
jgi:AcrR family transcriptional regulator